ncbi:MAG: RNA polymerase sigma factor [Candidatus Hydrogenedentes bacterium]|nr:RNA polymerase sigma factor [Candidatus Hydrogenedentota bacterium]
MEPCVENGHGLDAFLRQVEDSLYTFLLRLIRDVEDAHGTARETVARVLRLERLGRVPEDSANRRALVFSMAYHLAMGHVRTRRWASTPALQEEPPPDRPLDELMALRQMERALDELPAPQRDALLLRVFGELRYADIAHTLRCTVELVRTWVCHARRSLAAHLQSEARAADE